MKRVHLYIIACIGIILTGCKKDYDLDLNAANKSYLVVEGILTDQQEPQTIRLSRTVSYLAPEAPATVDNASISVTCDNNSVSYTLLSPGIYAAPSGFKGEIGKTYYLKIMVDGKLYEAKTTMTNKQVVDSIKTQRSAFNTDKYEIRGSFQENPEKGSYALFKYALNDVMQDSVSRWSYYSDIATNGEHFFNARLFGDVDGNDGDKITVYTYSIEKAFYDFINAADASLREPMPFFPPPGASITGNISNGALGYFQASAVSKVVGKFKK